MWFVLTVEVCSACFKKTPLFGKTSNIFLFNRSVSVIVSFNSNKAGFF